MAIGVDVDQSNYAPDTVLTSAIKKIPESVYQVLHSVKNETFTGGNTVYGIHENGVGISPFNNFDTINLDYVEY